MEMGEVTEQGAEQVSMDMEDAVIRTENLSKTYKRWFRPGTCALNDLTITVPKGSIFGFLGPNGAGKTTTIKILMDLIKCTAGKAYVLGKPSYDVDVKAKIGFLPDSPAFSPQLTAYEFLNICAKLLRLPSEVRPGRIEEVLSDVKMADHARDKIGSFSRGMLQRVGVAQALLNKPELLTLDEPLLGLDPFGRQEFKNIILSQRERGTSVFFSSHILSDVEEICDRIAILNKGRLLCTGRLDELLSANGATVTIAPGHDDILKDLITTASGTSRQPDGAWVLNFEHLESVKPRLDELAGSFPEAVKVSAGHEKLEDFFFRCLENDRSKAAMDDEAK